MKPSGVYASPPPEPLEDDIFDDFDYCWKCDGRGYIVVCIDDLCQGAGECMHGDGEVVCPNCKGESGW